MNILFVTPQLPWPPAQGTTLRNYHLLAAAAAEHRVDLLSFDDGTFPAAGPGSAPLLPESLTTLCGRIETVPAPRRSAPVRARDLAAGWADMERRLWSPAFAARLDRLLATGGYDAVQLEGFEVAGYLLGPAALRAEARGLVPPRPPIVFDDHNAEFALQSSAARIDRDVPSRWLRAAYSLVQARRLRRREALYCAGADLTLAVSEDDAAALERVVPHLHPVVVPNGVDCGAFPPPAPAPEPTLFFSGKLDYRPNVDACEWLVRDILPLVRRRQPGVRLVLAGRDPAPAVRRLVGPGVEVTGALQPEQIDRRRAAAWVYVVPMRMGSGVRFKVLEAMAAGVAVVSTPLGAAGTGIVDGEHGLIANDAAGLAGAVLSLLEGPAARARLTAAARALAERRHDWRHIGPRLLAAYRGLGRPSRPPVSLITTVLNERPSIGPLLASVAGQSRPPDEMVVVDGGSTDGTAEALRRPAARVPVTLEALPGSNISQGRNAAVRRARHDVIAATDAGVELHPRWLERLTAVFDRSAEVQAASGFFVAAPQTTWERALGATTLPDVAEIDPARFLPSSRSIAFRRRAWQGAGGYPEWLDYCEDLLFDLALLAGGDTPRFVPRATVLFRPRSSLRAFFTQYYRYARGDGKARLWGRRHAIRYGSYVAGAVLLAQSARPGAGRWGALALLAAGGAGYLFRPFVRLAEQCRSLEEFCRAAPLVPLARLTGDVAKMIGYPVGIAWRLRHRRDRAPLRGPQQA